MTLEERPKAMSRETMIALFMAFWTVAVAFAAYSYGQGGNEQRMITIEKSINELESNNIVLTALTTRVVTLEGTVIQISKDQAAGYARGLTREEKVSNLNDRVVKIEAGMDTLISGQNRIENILERKYGYEGNYQIKDLEQEFKKKP